jgi:hypothetical protein
MEDVVLPFMIFWGVYLLIVLSLVLWPKGARRERSGVG